MRRISTIKRMPTSVSAHKCRICTGSTLASNGTTARLRTVVLFVATTLGCTLLHAQTDTLTLAPAVVTEATRTADMVSVRQLSGADLHTLRGHSVADAMRYFSGVQIKDYGGVGGLKTVNVRGLGTQHVGVMLDGVPLSNAQNGVIDLGRFSLEEMAAVTLYNGQRTTLLQPAACFASSSAVYLERREPFADDAVPTAVGSQRGAATAGRVTLRAGSYGTARAAFSLDRRLSPRLSATLGVGYLHSDGNYRFRYRVAGAYDTTGVRRGGDIDALRAEAGLYGRGAKDKWQLRAYLYASGRGLPGAVVRGRSGGADRQWDTELNLQGTWRRDVSARYVVLTTARAAYDRLRFRSDPERDPAVMYADNTYRTFSLYLSTAHRVTLPALSLAWAADYRAERMLADLYDFATPTRHTAYTSLAAQTGWRGVRVQGALLVTLVADRTRHGDAMRCRTELSPSLALTFRPAPSSPLTLRAFVKRVFRMPTLCDLYYTQVGSSDLRPERTVQADAGLTLALPQRGAFLGGEVTADVYHNTVRDKIVAIPGTSMFRWTMLNLGRVSIQGAEIAIGTAWRVGAAQIDLRATYTYERARDVTDRSDPLYGDQIPYIPRHSGSLTARAVLGPWTLRYSFLYTGQRHDGRANTPENFVPAWYTSDCALLYARGGWEVSAEVNNLFQQRYEIVRGYPLPGRNFLLGLTRRF